jgi:hypothetical protein
MNIQALSDLETFMNRMKTVSFTMKELDIAEKRHMRKLAASSKDVSNSVKRR